MPLHYSLIHTTFRTQFYIHTLLKSMTLDQKSKSLLMSRNAPFWAWGAPVPQLSARTGIWPWKGGFGRLTLTFRMACYLFGWGVDFWFVEAWRRGCMPYGSQVKMSTGWIICPGSLFFLVGNLLGTRMNSLQFRWQGSFFLRKKSEWPLGIKV